jgi:hypothetical protein
MAKDKSQNEAVAEEVVNEAPVSVEVKVEEVVAVEEVRTPSAATLAEMEAGRQALAAHAASAIAEKN